MLASRHASPLFHHRLGERKIEMRCVGSFRLQAVLDVTPRSPVCPRQQSWSRLSVLFSPSVAVTTEAGIMAREARAN